MADCHLGTEASSERWATVDGFQRYQVSSLGRVRRSKVIGVALTSAGYPRVAMWSLGAKRPVYKLVHRMVLESFIGPCPDGMEACHGDGDRTNARLDNLRWDSRRANHADKRVHGTSGSGSSHWSNRIPERVPRGSRHWASKLTDEQVSAVLASDGKCKDVGSAFGISAMTVSRIRRGHRG